MRGNDLPQDAVFSYPSPGQGVPDGYPLRAIWKMADTMLKRFSPCFKGMHADGE